MGKKGKAVRDAVAKIYCSIIGFYRIRLIRGSPRLFRQIGVSRGLMAGGFAAGALFLGAMAGTAGSGDPGSPEDPLVTRSYMDAQLKVYADKYMQWQVVDLSPGQQLEGKAGAELIVRVGQTVAVDPTGSGIPDVTGGSNIAAGQNVALNHLLIVPRSDGRGISARTRAVVMYKGEIKVK